MAFDPDKITVFAKTDARGQHVPFGIKAKDRQRHVYVIGKTGMGKSTMLENMAVQDIQNGEGLAFIDPHGATAEKLLDFIPEHRVQDVLYFAPFDTDYPVAFNVMEDVGADKRHLVASGLMSVFKKIFVDQWSARMEYILQNTILALLEYPDSTLLGVNRMLSDKEYRKLVIDNISDPSVKSFWVDEFLKYNERYMQEAGDAIKNKIGQFTANPVIRNIIGQPKSSFDIREMMDQKKIIIMNLSKGLIGETNANLLGSMLTTRIYLAAMSRANLPAHEMNEAPNFYFYVDEFQSFANATFANILSEARKYKLNLTIAHQYIEQMEEEVRDAVFGNVGTTIAFRVGPFDAEVLETIFSPKFLATDIVNLGFAQIYLTLMIDGIGSQPFSAVTLPPIEPAMLSCKEMVMASSRRQFAHPRAGVETLIEVFHQPVIPVKQSASKVDTRATPAAAKPTYTPRREERKSDVPSTEQVKTPRREESGERRSKPPQQKDLGSLRDTLRTIVSSSNESKENRSGGKKLYGNGTKNAPSSEKAEDARADLKATLAQVLAGSAAAPSAPKESSHAPVIEKVVEKEKVIEKPSTHSVSEDVGYTNTISPKELERMMRTKTEDRPPLK
ncbi:hypothetical protein COU16_00055 [Candidatus Kaiserbacteria bacterium CG10_big_fil_rev_8_21_14_0_10_47_16]|uniref:Type IV secretion system coupling protein TraD DNA-binding domain-containing protein n=1 Tax=Candidatus Kaiserbacteria bacterium CG10_big_fil_rev_8_21_14_0_10_47_16 TaxID=1974608 RepID=A0A2H0UEW1_9BACT|nr:MAG: hypothetical protein COU16_00055 [Candidatus Kaiserbacteria bacterium CG10_big_fil_rev_8_21_14_0_10_47_16]